MALELTCLPEALGTDGAHKVPLARVDVLVSLFKQAINILGLQTAIYVTFCMQVKESVGRDETKMNHHQPTI